MNESSNKRFVIVGVFVFIALLFLGAGVLLVGSLHKTFEKKIEVVTIFDDIAGLQKGNNIWLSGVKVGIVSNIAFCGNSKVEVRMQIESKAQQFIPNDSKVKISSDGLIGNKILVIYGGTDNVMKIKEGDTLKVEKTVSSEDMLNTLQKSNENVYQISNDLKIITGQIVKGEGTIGKLLMDDSAYRNFNAATQSLQTTMENAKQIVSSLKTFTSNLNKTGTLANELATDTIVFSSIRMSVLHLQQIADTASILIGNLKKDINNPGTPAGTLLHDQTSGNQLKETIRNLESSSKKLDEDLEALQHSFLLKRYFKNKVKQTSSDTVAK